MERASDTGSVQKLKRKVTNQLGNLPPDHPLTAEAVKRLALMNVVIAVNGNLKRSETRVANSPTQVNRLNARVARQASEGLTDVCRIMASLGLDFKQVATLLLHSKTDLD